MDLARGPRVPGSDPLVVPAGPLQPLVDDLQLVVEQFVVVAVLEQLRVGELDDLQRRLGAGDRVVDERRIPGRDDEVVAQVRDPMFEDLLLLLLD